MDCTAAWVVLKTQGFFKQCHYVLAIDCQAKIGTHT